MSYDLESLYEAFSKYRKPKNFPLCECCFSENDMKIVLNKNLRDIPADEISNYASSVFLTVGSKMDFLYFFPRIFELSINDLFDWPDPEVVFRAIKDAEWDTWSIDEQELVLSHCYSKFINLISVNPYGCDIDQWLCAISHIDSDLNKYLNLLLKEENSLAFKEFIDWNMGLFSKEKLTNGFWEDIPQGARKLMVWLKQEKVSVYLANTYGMYI